LLDTKSLVIKNTIHLYNRVLDANSRKELANAAGVGDRDILELTKLTDLSRIKWVGVNFARVLYDLGIDTVEKATKADPVKLHTEVNQLNKERNIYKGQIGLNDMKRFVEAAKEVPLEINYNN
jgi:hypothetical protein